MRTVVVDFESYYDAVCTVKQRKLTLAEYSRHPRFRIFGAAVGGGDGFRWVGVRELPEALEAVDWSRTAFVGHNVAFDGWLARMVRPGLDPALWVDTAAMARYVRPHCSAELAEVVRVQFPDDPEARKGSFIADLKGVTLEDVEDDPFLLHDLAEYAIRDAVLCHRLFMALRDEMPKSEYRLVDQTVRMELFPTLAVNRRTLAECVEWEKADRAEKIAAGGEPESLLSSNAKFADVVERRTGEPVPMKPSPSVPGKMIPALAKSDTGWLALKRRRPDLAPLWAARERVKSRIGETRASRMLSHADPVTGAFPVPLLYGAAHTMRFGGAGGINPQNLPKGGPHRRAIRVLDPNTVLHVLDYSAVEPRTLAWVTGDPVLGNAFRENRDPYCEFASVYFNRFVGPGDPERQFGKAAILGLGYGMGATRFEAMLEDVGVMGVRPEEVERAVGLYRKTYAHIRLFWRACGGMIEAMLSDQRCELNQGLLYDPADPVCRTDRDDRGGRGLRMPEGVFGALRYPGLERNLDGDCWYRGRKGPRRIFGGMLTENIVQKLARHIMTDALLRVEDAMPEIVVAGHQHDEGWFVGPKEGAEERHRRIVAIMEAPPPWAPGLALKVEGEYGEYYSK